MRIDGFPHSLLTTIVPTPDDMVFLGHRGDCEEIYTVAGNPLGDESDVKTNTSLMVDCQSQRRNEGFGHHWGRSPRKLRNCGLGE